MAFAKNPHVIAHAIGPCYSYSWDGLVRRIPAGAGRPYGPPYGQTGIMAEIARAGNTNRPISGRYLNPVAGTGKWASRREGGMSRTIARVLCETSGNPSTWFPPGVLVE